MLHSIKRRFHGKLNWLIHCMSHLNYDLWLSLIIRLQDYKTEDWNSSDTQHTISSHDIQLSSNSCSVTWLLMQLNSNKQDCERYFKKSHSSIAPVYIASLCYFITLFSYFIIISHITYMSVQGVKSLRQSSTVLHSAKHR